MLVLFHLTQNRLQKLILINNVDLQDNAKKSSVSLTIYATVLKT